MLTKLEIGRVLFSETVTVLTLPTTEPKMELSLVIASLVLFSPLSGRLKKRVLKPAQGAEQFSVPGRSSLINSW